MFGRVSTVPLNDYLAKSGNNISGGVYLAKKFNDEYVKIGLSSYIPKVSGWVDVDEDTGERSYPDTTLPSNLAEWVISKEYSYYSQTIENATRFILDANASIGPFTLQEALYFYCVVKALKSEPFNQTISTSGAGFSLDVPLSDPEYEFTYSPEFVPDITNPNDLFTPSLKGRTSSYYAGYKDENNYDEDGDGSSFSSSIEAFVGGGYGSYGDTNVTILVDVDKLSDFYILLENTAGLSGGDSVYYAYASCGASTSDGGTAQKSVYSDAYVLLNKFKTEFNGTELSKVGDEASKTEVLENGSTIITEVKYFEAAVNFEFGSVSKTVSAYGLETTVTTTYAYGDSPPPTPDVEVTGVRPTSPIVIKANKFWPYKNAQGEPVYNETTGVKLADPVP